MDLLDAVAQALLEKEKITQEEFEEFFKSYFALILINVHALFRYFV